MKESNKIRVAVLYGGRSAEHEISLQSATNVMQYLDPNRFEIVPIGIDKKGKWLLGNDIFKNSIAHQEVKALTDKTETWFTPEWIGQAVVTKQTESSAKTPTQFDVVFPAVHGTFCEDGTLQGLLELADMPYVGCGVLASAIGMDKDIAKRLSILAGIPVGPYLVIKQAEWAFKKEAVIDQIEAEIGLPVFVKPANTGSSIGITKAKTIDELKAAIPLAFEFDTKIVIEKALNVIELEVAVLESLEDIDPIVSVVGEIRSSHEFYSYDAKYLDEHGAELFIPAPIPESEQKKAQAMAKKIFTTLECSGMARVDLFLDKDSGQLYFNEINTLPGFTAISMYPKLMAASGISYPALLTHLVELAIKNHQIKSHLKRSYTD